MKRPEIPPNVVVKMGTFPPKPTTGWCWKHGRFLIPKSRSTQGCPSCLVIEAFRVLGKAVACAVEGIKEFSRSMEAMAKAIQHNFDAKKTGGK